MSEVGRTHVPLDEARDLVKKQWENAAERINTIAAMLPSAGKLPASNVTKALYAMADEFEQLGETCSKGIK